MKHSTVAAAEARDLTPASGPDKEAWLWRQWKHEGDAQARSELVALHLPYARIVAASSYAKRYHNEVEFDDYYQFASVGLLEAMDRYDPDVGVQFRTFASHRMHGAILDGLERATERQQQIAASQRLRAQRSESVKGAESEGDAGSRSPEKLLRLVAEAGLAFALGWLLDGTAMMASEDASEHLPFYRSVALRERRQELLQLVQTLPAQERLVIHHHYLQNVPFEEIAATMGLTRGRVSQIHRAGLTRLREALASSSGFDLQC